MSEENTEDTVSLLEEEAVRKALSPVLHWFDSDGEGEELTTLEIVNEVSQMLVEDREAFNNLNKQLRDIVRKHAEIRVAGGGGILSSFEQDVISLLNKPQQE